MSNVKITTKIFGTYVSRTMVSCWATGEVRPQVRAKVRGETLIALKNVVVYLRYQLYNRISAVASSLIYEYLL